MTPERVARLAVEWSMLLPSMGNARLHWRRKARKVKAQREATLLALKAHGVHWRLRELEPCGSLGVTLVRQAPQRIRDAHDNLPAAFKGVVDEVAKFFGVDDSDPRVRWYYRQAHGPAAVRIDFEVLTAAELVARVRGIAPRADAVGERVAALEAKVAVDAAPNAAGDRCPFCGRAA